MFLCAPLSTKLFVLKGICSYQKISRECWKGTAGTHGKARSLQGKHVLGEVLGDGLAFGNRAIVAALQLHFCRGWEWLAKLWWKWTVPSTSNLYPSCPLRLLLSSLPRLFILSVLMFTFPILPHSSRWCIPILYPYLNPPSQLLTSLLTLTSLTRSRPLSISFCLFLSLSLFSRQCGSKKD